MDHVSRDQKIKGWPNNPLGGKKYTNKLIETIKVVGRNESGFSVAQIVRAIMCWGQRLGPDYSKNTITIGHTAF